jgi:hypothetical protein
MCFFKIKFRRLATKLDAIVLQFGGLCLFIPSRKVTPGRKSEAPAPTAKSACQKHNTQIKAWRGKLQISRTPRNYFSNASIYLDYIFFKRVESFKNV